MHLKIETLMITVIIQHYVYDNNAMFLDFFKDKNGISSLKTLTLLPNDIWHWRDLLLILSGANIIFLALNYMKKDNNVNQFL